MKWCEVACLVFSFTLQENGRLAASRAAAMRLSRGSRKDDVLGTVGLLVAGGGHAHTPFDCSTAGVTVDRAPPSNTVRSKWHRKELSRWKAGARSGGRGR